MVDKGVNIENLKARIEQNGHSLSRNSIGNIINGRNSPKIETMQLIADALEVELWELFSTASSEDLDNTLNGFIEHDGQIHRIKTKNDLKLVLAALGEEVEPKSTSTEPEMPGNITIQPFINRRSTGRKSTKLSRHVLNKYNITICNKRELVDNSNNLQRDTKIWVFRSKDDAQSAKAQLKKTFNFKINE